MSVTVAWSSGPDTGQTFPPFELLDQHGQLTGFAAHRAGRPSIVVFIRSADW